MCASPEALQSLDTILRPSTLAESITAAQGPVHLPMTYIFNSAHDLLQSELPRSIMVSIPEDWALYQTYLAGELIYDSCVSRIHGLPRKDMPIGLLDVHTCIALEHLAGVLVAAYLNPGMSLHLKITSEH